MPRLLSITLRILLLGLPVPSLSLVPNPTYDPELLALEKQTEADLFSYSLQLYVTQKPPIFGTVDPEEIQELAGQKLHNLTGSDSAFWYIKGSAGYNLTFDANRAAFTRRQIVPRMLVDATVRNLSTTLFGVTYPSPLIIAPVGLQGLVHKDAEFATARVGAALNVPYVLSSAATRSIEEVAQQSGTGPRWFQLYWPKHEDVTLSLLNRAKANNFSALVITLDTTIVGWRVKDLEHSYLPFIHAVGTSVGLSDPVFMSKLGLNITNAHPSFPYNPAAIEHAMATDNSSEGDVLRTRVYAARHWLIGESNSGKFHSWDELAFVRKHWKGPLILKGIQSVQDAEHAIVAGVDGIAVSNHGGRQVDGAIGSLDALELIMRSSKVLNAQASGKFTVLFDSGIRTGADALKAIALGAQGVMIGRPFMYGLALEGQEGVQTIIRSLLSDLSYTLGLSGHVSLAEIQGKGFSGGVLRGSGV